MDRLLLIWLIGPAEEFLARLRSTHVRAKYGVALVITVLVYTLSILVFNYAYYVCPGLRCILGFTLYV